MKRIETELKVGLFVSIGVVLIMISIIVLGGTNNILTRQNTYSTRLRSVEGLVVGAKVVLGGLPVGVVKDIEFEPTGLIAVTFKVPKKYGTLIRKDTEIEIATQGVLGDKFLTMNAGQPEHAEVPDGGEIPNHPTKGFAEVLSRSDALMSSLTSISASLDRILRSFESESKGGNMFRHLTETSKNLSMATTKLAEEMDGIQLKKASKSLASILEKVNNGTGTLGALINDPGLYDDTKALMGGANRNRIIRNLVRKTVKDGDEAAANDVEKK